MMDKCREEFERWYETLPDAERPPFRYAVWQGAWNARQPEVVGGLNGCGYDKCPKCGGGLATFRHPGAKVNCANCGLVLQEEGGRKLYQPIPYQNTVVSNASSVLVPTIDELAEAMYQDNTALLTNVEARYIAKVVHKLLTKSRGGA